MRISSRDGLALFLALIVEIFRGGRDASAVGEPGTDELAGVCVHDALVAKTGSNDEDAIFEPTHETALSIRNVCAQTNKQTQTGSQKRGQILFLKHKVLIFTERVQFSQSV